MCIRDRVNTSGYGGTRANSYNNNEGWVCSNVRNVDLKTMRAGETVTGAAKREIINQVEGGQLSMVSSQEEHQVIGGHLEITMGRQGIIMDLLPVLMPTERKTRADSGREDLSLIHI